MYGLTKKEKLKFILEKVSELEVSAYDIAKNTTLTESGVLRILNGTSKNPQENSLNAIILYLESKVLGSNLKGNNTQNLVAEPKQNYKSENENYMLKFSACLEEKIELMKKVEFLKSVLRENNINFID